MPELTEEQLSQMSPEQIAELQKQNCIFCHIASGKIPGKKIYEDDLCVAFLDINPATKGHILLTPKEHYMILPHAPEEIIKHLGKISKLLSKAAIRGLGATGTNIFIANGATAGQRAPHLIVHIIPRNDDDTITCFDLPEKKITEQDMKGMQTVLAQRLGTKIESVSQKRSGSNKSLEEIDLKTLKEFVK